MIYAAVHQYGWDEKNIPARPYLGVSDENRKEIEATVEGWLKKVMR